MGVCILKCTVLTKLVRQVRFSVILIQNTVITCGDKRINRMHVVLISSNKGSSEFWGGLFTVLLSFWNSMPSCMKFCAGLPISDFMKKTLYFFYLAVQMKKLLSVKNISIVLNQIFQNVCDICSFVRALFVNKRF